MSRILLAAVLGLVSLANAQTAQDAKNKDMSAFLRQLGDTSKAISDGYAKWTEAAKSKNVDAIVSMYADDATILPDEKDLATGRDGIRRFYTDWFAQPEKLVDEKFENIRSVQEGSLLVDVTKYSGTIVREGNEVPIKGKRLVVWKRDLQGKWKILRDTWNRSPQA